MFGVFRYCERYLGVHSLAARPKPHHSSQAQPAHHPSHSCALQNVAKFENHRGPVTALSFSENGYYLATGAADGVKLWDLRKLRNFRSLSLEGGVQDLAFDRSGLFLGVAGGEDARVYGSKQDWALLSRFPDLPKRVRGWACDMLGPKQAMGQPACACVGCVCCVLDMGFAWPVTCLAPE